MSKPHLLMIDDDADDQMIIQDTLRDMEVEHEVSFAAGGKQAMGLLHILYCNQTLPCLIILDLNMPSLNGIQTLELIRADKRFSDLKVAIFSTSMNPIEKQKAVDLGIIAYEIKPTTFDEAVITCRRFLDYCEIQTA